MRTTGAIVCVVTALLLSLQPAIGQDLDKLKSYMETTTPTGVGPFPAVMMISGCFGFGFSAGRYDDVQEQLTKLGFLVIRVDSLKARGQDTCYNRRVSIVDQVEDIQTAATYLRSQTNVKKDAINVLGWSWGGGAALAAAVVGAGINAAVAYFPACGNVPDKAVNVPTLVFFGEADNVVPIAMCKSIFSTSKILTLRMYPGVHHGFDNPKNDPPREYRFGTLGYSEPATKAAWAELKNFLKR